MRRFDGQRGNLEVVEHRSRLLEGNPLGDSELRQIAIWTPPGYASEDERRYPLLVDLAGFTGSGLKHTSWNAFTENLPERLDRLVGSGQMAPCVVAMPDGFTALGGNQYIDSPAVGPWASYLVEELVPFLDQGWKTLASSEHRGVFGKSSGGYGSLIHGMKYADTWGAIACHSGDMYFPYGYLPDFPLALDTLRRCGGRERFLEKFRAKVKHRSADVMTLMILAMAAFYDPDLERPGEYHLPFDLETGEIIEERWSRWLDHDPVQLVDRHADALKSLKLIFVDCGFRDQFRLHHGSRILTKKMTALGIEHVYQEFDD
ncbi:MAG: alpha/beta hydrolase-fold protein, partial [Planctomycetota bacterium]